MGNFFINIDVQSQVLVIRAFLNHVDQIVYRRRKFILHGNNFHFARFNFAKVKDVVHQPQKRLAGIMNVFRIAQNHGVSRLAQNHFVKTKHRIYRRADFVTHAGKECWFCFVCRLSDFQIVFQLFFVFHLFNVARYAPRHDFEDFVQFANFIFALNAKQIDVKHGTLLALGRVARKVLHGARHKPERKCDGLLRVVVCKQRDRNGHVHQQQKQFGAERNSGQVMKKHPHKTQMFHVFAKIDYVGAQKIGKNNRHHGKHKRFCHDYAQNTGAEAWTSRVRKITLKMLILLRVERAHPKTPFYPVARLGKKQMQNARRYKRRNQRQAKDKCHCVQRRMAHVHQFHKHIPNHRRKRKDHRAHQRPKARLIPQAADRKERHKRRKQQSRRPIRNFRVQNGISDKNEHYHAHRGQIAKERRANRNQNNISEIEGRYFALASKNKQPVNDKQQHDNWRSDYLRAVNHFSFWGWDCFKEKIIRSSLKHTLFL